MMVPYGCFVCGFDIRWPLANLRVSQVGLTDDGRYPGRLIVGLTTAHHEHLDDVPSGTVNAFMADIRYLSRVLRGWDSVDRVNVAILGNREAHVHAHLIPRRPREPNHDRAPWDTDVPRSALKHSQMGPIAEQLLARLDNPTIERRLERSTDDVGRGGVNAELGRLLR